VADPQADMIDLSEPDHGRLSRHDRSAMMRA
jgi:hypothetical protein